MSDQCKNCTLRGDLTQCMLTDCTQHDSWMVKQLERQLEEVQKENTQLKEMREHLKWKDETRKDKERLERQLKEMPDPPGKSVEGIPPQLDVIVMKCVAKEPDERFQSISQLQAALHNLRT